MNDHPANKPQSVAWLAHGVGLAVLVGGGLLVYWIGWGPLQSQCQAESRRIEELERLKSRAATIQRTHSALQAELASLEARAAAVRRQVPELPQEAELLTQLTRNEGDEGLKIRDYRRSGVTVRDTHAELRVVLKGVGDYRSLCAFVDGLEKLDRLVVVESFGVREDPREDAYPVDLTLVLYYGLKLATNKEQSKTDG